MISKKYNDKLNEILNKYEEKHLNFYFNKSKEEVEEFIRQYIEDNDINNNYDFVYFINCIIKQALDKYDSHTLFKKNQSQMPLYFKWLDDGFYVVKCEKGYEKYLYSKLEKVNEIELEKIKNEIEKSTCYSTNAHLTTEIERYLGSSQIFLLPSISKDYLNYELSKDNNKINLEVDLNNKYKYSIYNKENYSIDIKDNTIILTYNSCSDFEKMKKTIDKIIELVRQNDISNFILDLRGNSGGNSSIIKPLIHYLGNTDLNLVTLIDRYVFSSGRWAIEDMKSLGSKFIGQDIGTTINCFGENKNELIKIDDNTEGIIQCATKYFGLDDNNKLTSIPKEKLNKETIKMINVHPDIYVNESIEDIKEGKDVYLQEAFNYLNSLDDKKVTITKEQYDKLNDYYNRLCVRLSINDDLFLNNLNTLGLISSKLLHLLDNIDTDLSISEDHFTFLEIYEKSKELLNRISPKLVEDFSKIMSNGVLDADYQFANIKGGFGNSSFSPNINNYDNYDPDKSTVLLADSFSYDAVPILIHEYFHKTNYSNNKARYILTEYISIYFELYAYELLKQDGVSTEKLCLNERLVDLKSCADFIIDKGFFLHTFNELGNYDDNSYKFVNYTNVTRNQFNTGLLERLKEFEKLEDNYKKNPSIEIDYLTFDNYLRSKYNKVYKYLLGSLLAYYSLYNSNKDDVLKLNNALVLDNTITLDGALNILGIQLNNELETKAYEAIEKYINENNLKKEEENTMKM